LSGGTPVRMFSERSDNSGGNCNQSNNNMLDHQIHALVHQLNNESELRILRRDPSLSRNFHPHS
jgi:hypothetical protein